MTAGVLQGAPAVVFDLDILYSRAEDNVERLLAAVEELDAVFRGDSRRLRPKASHLRSAGTLQLQQLKVRVLALKKRIEVKRLAGRAKDLAMLPLLEATLARSTGNK